MLEDLGRINRSNRRLQCENTKFKVYFESISDGSSEPVKDFLVVSPKNSNEDKITGVAVLPVYNGFVGLISIYRPPLDEWCLEIPHGFIEANEDVEFAAIRELAEETGLIVDEVKLLGVVAPDSGIVSAKVKIYLANGNNINAEKIVPEIGVRDFFWFDISDFESMIRDCKIIDSYTLSAWGQYRVNLNPS